MNQSIVSDKNIPDMISKEQSGLFYKNSPDMNNTKQSDLFYIWHFKCIIHKLF